MVVLEKSGGNISLRIARITVHFFLNRILEYIFNVILSDIFPSDFSTTIVHEFLKSSMSVM
jgi:hypothetical protein